MKQHEKKYLFLLDDGWRCEKLDLLYYLKGKIDFGIATHDKATWNRLKDDFSVHMLARHKTPRRFIYYFIKLFASELPTNNIRYKREIKIRRGPLLQRLLTLVNYIAPRFTFRKYRCCHALDFLFRTSDFHGKLLSRYDVFIFSPVHMFDKRIIYEAKNHGLKVVCWVYSWDNPMKDNEFMENASRYFVWNSQCAEALCKLHPVPREKVDIVGPVQFDYLIEQWNQKPPAPGGPGRYVMYACATALPEHTDQEVNMVINIRRILDSIDPEVKLLVRPYPYRNAHEVYRKLLNRPNIELAEFGHVTEEMILMTKEDLLERQSQIEKAMCLINFASTIGLEASFTQTPIVQLNFNFPHQYPSYIDIKEVLKNDHLKLVTDPEYPNTANNAAELKNILSEIVAGRKEKYMKYSDKLQLFANPLKTDCYKQVFLNALKQL